MATREVLEWVCDLCDYVGEMVTHEVSVDGRAVELEACPACWAEPAAVFDKLCSAGRASGRRRKPRVRV